jgi:excisionase family DNA binding protein
MSAATDVFLNLRLYIDQKVEATVDARMKELERRAPRRAEELPSSDDEKYMNRQQVAEMTGYCDRTIYRLIRERKLIATGLKRNRIKRSDVERMMAEAAKERANGTGPANEEDEIAAEAHRLLDDE